MVKLKEYLGALIGDINQARVLADIESAKISQIYAQHELLKNFSIPRFRAQEIELDIPIAIEGLDTLGGKDFEPIDNRSFISITYTTLKNVAKVDSFSRNSAKLLNSLIAENTKLLESRIKAKHNVKESFQEFKKEMQTAFLNAVENDKITISDTKTSIQNLDILLDKNLLSRIKTRVENQDIENTNVIVEAAQLREISHEHIIKIKLKLYEDGMEWHTSKNQDGTDVNQLLPE
ncbi:MAG: hypothetical protein R6U95_08890 [Bacteroidales bacterium]